ncbi:MAG: hydroxyacid dehydrogenase [Rhodovulum sulfidophilum]|uniref:Hydroxyacid dehydrogenase n=1 Tax=Rhodovulum sulfidophilum TaxID=35806 RepID=A0A2W5N9A7_RHOSU|nr:MAG: hydroxyacid dehydrogenase [Rhodovulum sulfidophilum]
MSHKILVTAPSLAPSGLAALRRRGCDIRFVEDLGDVAGLARVLATEPIDAVISRTMPIDAAMLRACPSLKVISKHGTGVSNIDVDAASAEGVAVFSTPGANAAAVAEFTIGLMIAAIRRLPRFDRSVRAGSWARQGDGGELGGRTLGLVGFGRIARQVARVARALDMRVVVSDPYIDLARVAGQGVEFYPSLAAMLPECAVLSLHCPATRGAPPLLDAEMLSLLPRGAVVVNTARGELIDEAALAAALASGALGAAGLDTFAAEPLGASPLRAIETAVLTPHVAGSTTDALAKMAEGAAANVLDYLAALEAGPAALAALRERCLNPEIFARAPRGAGRSDAGQAMA